MKNKKFWENFILTVIILAIIELFLEDISRLSPWSPSCRKYLLILGFLFDLIFTVEFTVRSIIAKDKNGWGSYFAKEKGWVDFFSSVPLLFLNSGPIMLGMFFPGSVIALPFLGVLNILKITKILRIARILRLLRVLKLFKISESENEKRLIRINTIISVFIVTIASVLILSPIFNKVFYNMDKGVNNKLTKYKNILNIWYLDIRKRNIENIKFYKKLLDYDKNVIYLNYMGMSMVNHLNTKSDPFLEIPKKYFYTDYKVLNHLNFKLYISLRDEIALDARVNLLLETIIIVMIFSFLLFYKDPV